jgi:hypothetical protein
VEWTETVESLHPIRTVGATSAQLKSGAPRVPVAGPPLVLPTMGSAVACPHCLSAHACMCRTEHSSASSVDRPTPVTEKRAKGLLFTFQSREI